MDTKYTVIILVIASWKDCGISHTIWWNHHGTHQTLWNHYVPSYRLCVPSTYLPLISHTCTSHMPFMDLLWTSWMSHVPLMEPSCTIHGPLSDLMGPLHVSCGTTAYLSWTSHRSLMYLPWTPHISLTTLMNLMWTSHVPLIRVCINSSPVACRPLVITMGYLNLQLVAQIGYWK